MIKNLDEIKAKSDIVDIISAFIPLKKAGSNYQAPCPFHNEKSANLILVIGVIMIFVVLCIATTAWSE